MTESTSYGRKRSGNKGRAKNNKKRMINVYVYREMVSQIYIFNLS